MAMPFLRRKKRFFTGNAGIFQIVYVSMKIKHIKNKNNNFKINLFSRVSEYVSKSESKSELLVT